MKIDRPKSKQPLPENAKLVFKGKIFDVYQWEQEMYDGTTATFEKLKRPDTAVVFGVLDDGRILLTEQEQPGKAPFLGAAGGRIEEDEDPIVGAKRELLEETGYEAERWVLWDANHVTSKIDWVVYTFIAKGLKKVSGMNLDGGERIKLRLVTFDEFIELAQIQEFSEKEITGYIYKALVDKVKMDELRKLFDPKL